jgi:hypothetical protein
MFVDSDKRHKFNSSRPSLQFSALLERASGEITPRKKVCGLSIQFAGAVENGNQ